MTDNSTPQDLTPPTIAEVELIYRRRKGQRKVTVTCSQSAFEVLYEVWDKNKIDLVEEFKMLLLRHNNSCIAVSHVSTGGIAGCIADPRVIFATALKANACQIVVAHNHPSGNLRPSKADLDLTEKLVHAGKLLDIKVLDHLVISSEGFTSMADEGYMPC